VYYFIVETRGYTLEEIALIFDTEGLTWKQRRNLKAPGALRLEDLPGAQSPGGKSSSVEVDVGGEKSEVRAVSTEVRKEEL
jgi:hypothetical protein